MSVGYLYAAANAAPIRNGNETIAATIIRIPRIIQIIPRTFASLTIQVMLPSGLSTPTLSKIIAKTAAIKIRINPVKIIILVICFLLSFQNTFQVFSIFAFTHLFGSGNKLLLINPFVLERNFLQTSNLQSLSTLDCFNIR